MPVFWVLKYLFNRKFRWAAEKEAFRAEIKKTYEMCGLVDVTWYPSVLVSQYGKMCSFEEARSFVEEVMKEIELGVV